jgi:hypothetical protein
MGIVTRPRPPVKPGRSVCWLFRPDRKMVSGTILIRVGKLETVYRLEEIPGCAFGRGLSLRKMGGPDDGQTYNVLLAHSGQGHDSCECLGYLRWHHCKHVSGCRALLSRKGVQS